MTYGMTVGELAHYMPGDKAREGVLDEALQALRKHGPPTPNLQRALNLMLEELGEVAQCVNKITSPNPKEREFLLHTPEGDLPIADDMVAFWTEGLRRELCQLAAYAMLQIQRLDNEQGRT